MEKNERAPLWAWGAILTLLVLVLVGWGELYAQRQDRPEDVPLYGTFGTCRIVDIATFLTFDGDRFCLYLGQEGEVLDEGTWTMSEDTATLDGQDAVYDLVVKGDCLYLSGGAVQRLTRFERYEARPVYITAVAGPASEETAPPS